MDHLYFAVLMLLLTHGAVEGVPSNCGATYQTQLKNLLTLKGSCADAGFEDCCQAKNLVSQAGTGTYNVNSPCKIKDPFSAASSSVSQARCDMETDNGGWLLIQRRINGSVDFYRNWTYYVNGFGDLEGEFWYGLENIHCLTTRDDVELRIELGNGGTPSVIWTYQLFKVGGASTDYILTIGQGQGVGGTFDAMAHSNGRKFSTKDADNDNSSSLNCATQRGAGWWFGSCTNSNLNGKYQYHTPGAKLYWYSGSSYVHYTKVQMKIRPKNCAAKNSSQSCN